MTDEKRQAERVPVGLRVRLRYANLDAFIAGYATNISRNGVFLEGVAPRPPETLVRFELVLDDGSVAMRGEGRVIWSRPAPSPGLALRFARLDAKSKALLDDLVSRSRIAPRSISMFPGPPTAASPVAALPSSAPRTRPVPSLPPPVPAAALLRSMPAPMAPPVSALPPPPPPARASLLDLERELEQLSRETFERISRPSRVDAPRRSLPELDLELAQLAASIPARPAQSTPLAVAPASHRLAPVQAPASIAPFSQPTDYDDLPAVLAVPMTGQARRAPVAPSLRPLAAHEMDEAEEVEALDDDAIEEIDEHTMAAAPGSAPAMREPTPAPESGLPDALRPSDEPAPLVNTIPQAPRLPRTGFEAIAGSDPDLPDLDSLGEPDERADDAADADTTEKLSAVGGELQLQRGGVAED